MNKESGRSLVEMLGVLAVIGVLSIGAIADLRNVFIMSCIVKEI